MLATVMIELNPVWLVCTITKSNSVSGKIARRLHNLLLFQEHEYYDIIHHKQVQICTSKYESYFNGVVYGIKGLLLVFGAFLAWETRKVRL